MSTPAVIAERCGSEQQLGNAPGREPEAGRDVVEGEAAIAFEAFGPDHGLADRLALQRLDGIAPEL
jgi:hypothetical protein